MNPVQLQQCTLSLSLPPGKYHTDVYRQIQSAYQLNYNQLTYTITDAIEIQKTIPRVSLPLMVYLAEKCVARKKIPSVLPWRDPFSSQMTPAQMEVYQHHLEKNWSLVAHDSRVNQDPSIQQALRFIQQTFPQLYGSFIPLDVQYAFEQHPVYHSTVHCEMDKYTVTLQMYDLNGSLHPTFVQELLARILSLLQLSSFPCTTQFFFIFLSNCKKEKITDEEHCWTSFHVNTGCTYRYRCGEITIWRKEELLKTVYHEMIHALGWDSPIDQNETISQQIHHHFDFVEEGAILVHEAYTETWATLLNVYVCASSEDQVQMLVDQERRFILFQVAKTLHASGIESFRAFLSKQAEFCQTTNVFSYFFMKSALLWDIAWFVDHFPTGEFSLHSVTSEELWGQIYQVLTSEEYITAIEQMMNGCDFTQDQFMMRTMRMTSVECVRL